MTIHVASDHAGFALKKALSEFIATLGHKVVDHGDAALDPDDDYPDFIRPCAEAVAADTESRGVVIGGDGQGEGMVANRIPGARAAVFYGGISALAGLDREGHPTVDQYDVVRLSRKHNDANVLSLGARFISGEQAVGALRVFLDTAFSTDPRHARRIAKF